MPRMKINYSQDEREIIYSDEHWKIFKQKRELAREICEPFYKEHIPFLIYGSIARGDVNPNSDLDILINMYIPSYKIEVLLETNNMQVIGREIVQATPNDAIKGHIYLSNDVCITLFLTFVKQINYEFYKFGGAIDYSDILKQRRVAGVDKRLIIIIPTEKGHRELPLLNNEKLASELIGVSPKLIEIRKRVLMKRDKIGRTGVFLNIPVDSSESFEEVLKRISDKNPIVKRKFRK
ncbi:MAG: nucleotidyltransferase domain-containing protein [Promethearchaeota archaeon]